MESANLCLAGGFKGEVPFQNCVNMFWDTFHLLPYEFDDGTPSDHVQ
jgi:hypothetical protein